MRLKKLFEYQNRSVLQRYARDFTESTLTAEQAFKELMKYFWLKEKHKLDRKNMPDNDNLDFQVVMHYEMKEIDDMWHTFLLFTKDYADFCQHYLGEFIHNFPNTSEEKTPKEIYKQEFERYVSYVYDNLGKETLETWFSKLLSDEQ